jgi:hypothetical protein
VNVTSSLVMKSHAFFHVLLVLDLNKNCERKGV